MADSPTLAERIDNLTIFTGQELEFLNVTKADKTELAAGLAAVRGEFAALDTAQATALADGLLNLENRVLGADGDAIGSLVDTFADVRKWIADNIASINAVSDRVKITAQTLSQGEKDQVIANIGALSAAAGATIASDAATALSGAVSSIGSSIAAAAQTAADATSALAVIVADHAASVGSIGTRNFVQLAKNQMPSRYTAVV